MKARSAVLFLCGAVAIGVMAHCGTSPSQPQPPVTTPTTTTTTTQPAGIVLPPGMTCNPTPPPLYGISVKVWDRTNPNRWILDTNPQVINVDHYCARTNQGDNKFCLTRPEGDPERVSCDYLAVGQAVDTGRWGPTWTFENKPCDPPGAPTGSPCANEPNNQFRALAKGSGTFAACANPLARVDETQGSRCGVHDVVMD
ncbi:MAG TPA: hypothetical protein VEQ10_02590 [Vicinamibacteria bacterium]|nr:hypothetical protein [Vicinamibacteria bacterium]